MIISIRETLIAIGIGQMNKSLLVTKEIIVRGGDLNGILY